MSVWNIEPSVVANSVCCLIFELGCNLLPSSRGGSPCKVEGSSLQAGCVRRCCWWRCRVCGPSVEEAPPLPREQQELRAGGGPVILGGDDLTDHGSVDGNGEVRDGWFYIRRALENLKPAVRRPHDWSVAVLGSEVEKEAVCCDAGAAYFHAAPQADLSPEFFNGPQAIDQFFEELRTGQRQPAILVIVGTGALNDLEPNEGQALVRHAVEIANFVNAGGGLLAHGSGPDAYGWLQALIPGLNESEQAGCDVFSLTLTPEGQEAFPGLTNTDIQAGPCHSSFSGELGRPAGARRGWLEAHHHRRRSVGPAARHHLPSPPTATYEIGTTRHTVTATVRNGRVKPYPRCPDHLHRRRGAERREDGHGRLERPGAGLLHVHVQRRGRDRSHHRPLRGPHGHPADLPRRGGDLEPASRPASSGGPLPGRDGAGGSDLRSDGLGGQRLERPGPRRHLHVRRRQRAHTLRARTR